MDKWREYRLQALTDSVNTDADVFSRITAYSKQIGFDYCSIGVRRQLAVEKHAEIWQTNYPVAWQEYYHGHNFLQSDPVINSALRSSMPVVWGKDRITGPQEFWETASEHGVQHGWTFVLRGARDETLLLSLARSHDALDNAELAETEPILMWLAHSALAVLACDAEHAHDVDALTSREKEILHWALAGKTSEETAIILGITARTVNFHVSLILQKLNVVNKTQAVAKAVALHMLN